VMLSVDFLGRPATFLGALMKLRRPMLASFAGSTAARAADRRAVRTPRRRAVEAVLEAMLVVLVFEALISVFQRELCD
jgi:hypothetical protein